MRRRLIVSACLVFALLAGITIYKKRASLLPQPSSNQVESSPQVGLMSIPPFVTKEPERYQASRSTTFTESRTNAAAVETRTVRVLIARDGDRRREEYEAGALGTIVYLDTTAGRFVILPQARLYASQDDQTPDNGSKPLRVESEPMSPDFLLHESTVSSEYQKLGEEVKSGRKSSKYRVLARSGNSSIISETLIWVDEALGMPIASEFVSNNVNGSTRVLMELRDIKTQVEPGVFALPADYRKVPLSEILSMFQAATEAGRSPAAK